MKDIGLHKDLGVSKVDLLLIVDKNIQLNKVKLMKRIIVISLLLLGLGSNANADNHVKRILSTGKTALGNEIKYPEGQARITAFEFTVPVGGPVTPHTHSFPVLIIMQEGEATITFEDGTVSIYKPGDAFVEDTGIVHSSKSTGTVPIKALVVAMGVEGKKIMTPVK